MRQQQQQQQQDRNLFCSKGTSLTRHRHFVPSTRSYKYTIQYNFVHFHQIGTKDGSLETRRNVLQHPTFFFPKFWIVIKLQGSKVGTFLFSRLEIHKTNCGFQYIVYVPFYVTPQWGLKVRKKTFSNGYSIPIRFQVETKTSTTLQQISSAFRICNEKYDCVKTEKK